MNNNWVLLDEPLQWEAAYHAAGHLLADCLLRSRHLHPCLVEAASRVGSEAAEEAVAECVVTLAIDIDIALANGVSTLDFPGEHLDYLLTRDICRKAHGLRSVAAPLLDDEDWRERMRLLILQRHWWAVSTVAELSLKSGRLAAHDLASTLMEDIRCSPWAWQRTRLAIGERGHA